MVVAHPWGHPSHHGTSPTQPNSHFKCPQGPLNPSKGHLSCHRAALAATFTISGDIKSIPGAMRAISRHLIHPGATTTHPTAVKAVPKATQPVPRTTEATQGHFGPSSGLVEPAQGHLIPLFPCPQVVPRLSDPVGDIKPPPQG